ncbi:MAG: GerMN domain-containing protein [Treponema sp.]|nr:GerMN domain-containing protein [Treponema sp.]
MSEKNEKKGKNKKKTGLGIAIWILAFLIILIVFLVKQEEIKENFDRSGAGALIEKKIGKDIFEDKKHDSKKNEESGETVIDVTRKITKPEPEETMDSLKKSEPQVKKEEAVRKTEPSVKKEEPVPEKTVVSKTEEKKTVPAPKKEEPAQKTEQKTEKKTVKTETVTQKPKAEEKKAEPAPVSNTIKKKICFVAIDRDGPVVRKEVTRSVSKDSPMGDALNMLLAGPSSTEEKTGCRSLIPQGSRLLGASVKNGIATLNFSEEFQFNQFGAEGSLAQLMQVVYTATEFSTVKSVQILIEGQKRDYLTEGVWIGSPLARNSF